MQVALCAVAEVAPMQIKRVELNPGRAFAVYNLDGEFFVTDDLCTHGEASLSEGEIEDGCIICPYHMGSFDIRTGEPMAAPCTMPIRSYAVVVIDDMICIESP